MNLTINESHFEKIIEEIIEKKDEVIVLYSGIWSFINKIDFLSKKKITKIPEIILNIIEKKIGNNRILFLPSFTGNLFHKKKFINITNDIDKDNGVLPLTAIKRNYYYRTRQPIHSYLVFGNIKKVENLKLVSSWGKDSLLEFFSKRNARICTLGLPWNKGCAYLHRFEENFNVPWRYNKTFVKEIRDNKKILGIFSETKYCSSKLTELKYDFKPFIKYIKKSKSYKKTKQKNIIAESIKASCLDKIGKILFSKNPWIIVKNKKEIKNWIDFKKKFEIESVTK